MRKATYTTTTAIKYDSAHKGAPYTVDGIHYFNNGNKLEAVVNEWCGHGFNFDTKGVSFDKGSDIEELHASVKSSGASLACLYGETKEAIITEYFQRTASRLWIYVVEIDGEFWIYQMNQAEFAEMLDKFATTTKESGNHKLKVRFNKTSGKMIKWFEEKVGE